MIPFAQRAPSSGWEAVPLGTISPGLWCWFRPSAGPQDVYIQIPPETLTATAGQLTLRHLLAAAGLSPAELTGWMVNNIPVPLTAQTIALLDQPLGWVAGPVVLRTGTQAMTVHQLQPVTVQSTAGNNSDSELLFQRIDGDWQNILQLETNMGQLRKQLNGLAGRLKSLNRDLNMEESNAADSQDKRDWQDIRRWLRDAAASVSRSIREFDVGDLSAAGGRGRFEELHKEYVLSRKVTPNLPQIALEFETYRKLIQNQFQKMQTASAGASRDGEQRASQFLSRIAAKIRTARGKK